jgi:hypothetical protein
MSIGLVRLLILTHFPLPKLAKPLATTELDGNFGFHAHGYNTARYCDMSLFLGINYHDLRGWLIVSLRNQKLQPLSLICMAALHLSMAVSVGP